MENLIGIFALSALAIYFLGRAGYFLWQGLRSRGWLQTTGTISEAWVSVTFDTDNDRNQRNYLKVTYSYVVDGKTYEGKRVRYGDVENEGRRKQKALEKMAKSYRDQPIQIVYYNPENPQQAVLERGLRPFSVLVNVLYGLFALGFAIVFVLMALGRDV
ncbi:MAG: DUF3592 domain-containing protein [Anaerolineae bacterium]|nr:DUF3592 domain-containing protein [Anaerolineae bacterium]